MAHLQENERTVKHGVISPSHAFTEDDISYFTAKAIFSKLVKSKFKSRSFMAFEVPFLLTICTSLADVLKEHKKNRREKSNTDAKVLGEVISKLATAEEAGLGCELVKKELDLLVRFLKRKDTQWKIPGAPEVTFWPRGPAWSEDLCKAARTRVRAAKALEAHVQSFKFDHQEAMTLLLILTTGLRRYSGRYQAMQYRRLAAKLAEAHNSGLGVQLNTIDVFHMHILCEDIPPQTVTVVKSEFPEGISIEQQDMVVRLYLKEISSEDIHHIQYDDSHLKRTDLGFPATRPGDFLQELLAAAGATEHVNSLWSKLDKCKAGKKHIALSELDAICAEMTLLSIHTYDRPALKNDLLNPSHPQVTALKKITSRTRDANYRLNYDESVAIKQLIENFHRKFLS